jgi:acetyltransferase-like isoleucine patch superfamily enzyme
MKNLIFGIVFLSPPFLKKVILKWFCGAQFGRKSNIGWFSSIVGDSIAIGDYSTIKPLTLIRCDGQVSIGNYTEVSSFSVIYGCADFRVGNKCYIGPQTWINTSEDVVTGDRVGIGPRTMIFTHGSFFPYTEGYWARFGKVLIRNNVSLASDVFVHPGIEIGGNVFVNSCSVITQSIPSGQVVEGFPAKVVCPMEKVRRPITPAKRGALILNILKHFISFLQKTKSAIEVIHHEEQMALLRSRRRDYLITFINSKGIASVDFRKYQNKKMIALVNCHDRFPAISMNRILIFDFKSMKTQYSRDRVHQALYQFMRMYYGLIFEFE